MNFETLKLQVKTEKDRDLLLEEVDLLKNGLYDTHGLEKTYTKIRPQTATYIKESLAASGIDPEEFLTELKKTLEVLEALKITLAFVPSEEFVAQIHTWFLQNTGEVKLLEFSLDKELLAGAIFEHQGKYADYSLRKIWENAEL